MTDTLHDIEHKAAFDAIGLAAIMLGPNRDALQRLVDAEHRMHGFMHITNPTAYRQAISDPGLQHQVTLAKAALAFLDAVDTVKSQLEPGETKGN